MIFERREQGAERGRLRLHLRKSALSQLPKYRRLVAASAS